jgi:hypothetical protein
MLQLTPNSSMHEPNNAWATAGVAKERAEHLTLFKLADAALDIASEIHYFQGGVLVEQLRLSAQSCRADHCTFRKLIKGFILYRDEPADTR